MGLFLSETFDLCKVKRIILGEVRFDQIEHKKNSEKWNFEIL